MQTKDVTASITERAKLTAELATRFPNLVVLPESPFLLRVHTLIRDVNVTRPNFLFYSDQLIRTLIEYTFDLVPYHAKIVTTPTGSTFHGLELTRPIAGVSVMRAGESMEMALRATIRDVKIGKILVQRDEASPSKEAKLFYSKLPPNLSDHTVMLLDPMLASGSSAKVAIKVLLEQGVAEQDIIFVNLIAAPEGIDALFAQYPGIKIVTTMIDKGLNEDKYIIPGIGDFGDRYFGTL